jgi:hypothetical protein
MQQRRAQITRDGGRFYGFRVNCEQVPMLPAWAIRTVLDDPRKIPYLFVWKWQSSGEVKEAIRVIRRSGRASLPNTDEVELKRTDGSVVAIYPVWRGLPRGGGRSLLLHCPTCGRPCRALYGAKVGDDGRFYVARCANWECRRCAKLRYSSEGGALLIRPGRRLSGLFGTFRSPRPDWWLFYVLTSPEAAAEAGLC